MRSALASILAFALAQSWSPPAHAGMAIKAQQLIAKAKAPGRAKRQFNAYLADHQDLKQRHELNLRDEQVGRWAFATRGYWAAAGVNGTIGVTGLVEHLSSPHLWSKLTPGGIIPHLAVMSLVYLGLRAFRMDIKMKKARMDAVAETLGEALRLAETDPSYAIPAETLSEWRQAGLFAGKDLRKFTSKKKEKKHAEEPAAPDGEGP
jgi:hypothetical protein